MQCQTALSLGSPVCPPSRGIGVVGGRTPFAAAAACTTPTINNAYPTYNSYESPDLEISLIMVVVMVEQIIIDNDKKWDAAAGGRLLLLD